MRQSPGHPRGGILRRLADIVRFRAFWGDRRGVSAIEFALVAPILIMAYLGLSELTLGMMAARRTSHLTATIGDLAAQSDTLTDANITDLFAIANSMMAPFSTGTSLKIRLTSVTMGTDNKARTDWSKAQNMTPYADNTVLSTITTAQITANQSLMMTEVEYDWVSPIGNLLPGTSAFKDTFYHHPRNGAKVTRPAS